MKGDTQYKTLIIQESRHQATNKTKVANEKALIHTQRTLAKQGNPTNKLEIEGSMPQPPASKRCKDS